MLGLIVRILLPLAAQVTSWFAAKDAVNFSTVQMTVAVLLLAATVAALASWPMCWLHKPGRRQAVRP